MVAGTRLDPNNPDAALAAVVTPTRITCLQNYQAFMIVLLSLSKPIQTALLRSTDMATKGIRFLRRQYGAVTGDQEFSSFTAMYDGLPLAFDDVLTQHWLVDSGATEHATIDINVQELEEPMDMAALKSSMAVVEQGMRHEAEGSKGRRLKCEEQIVEPETAEMNTALTRTSEHDLQQQEAEAMKSSMHEVEQRMKQETTGDH
eukprot:gene2353-8660_t